jgi:hypothetical protein
MPATAGLVGSCQYRGCTVQTELHDVAMVVTVILGGQLGGPFQAGAEWTGWLWVHPASYSKDIRGFFSWG